MPKHKSLKQQIGVNRFMFWCSSDTIKNYKDMLSHKKEDKFYKKPLNITIFGLILIVTLIAYLSYRDFKKEFQSQAINITIKANTELEKSILYTENIANFIANQIIDEEKLTKENIAKILKNTKPRFDQNQNLFSQIFFDFIDPEGNIIITASDGILKQSYHIEKEKRSWIVDAKINPWKLIPAKKDEGIITKEIIIPCGFGITKKSGEFIGFITGGINVGKLQNKINQVSDKNYSITLLDSDNAIVFTSDLEIENKQEEIKTIITKSDPNSGFIKLKKNQFYYQKTDGYDFKILVGIDRVDYAAKFLKYSLPEILENFYLAAFLVVATYLVVRILFL